MKQNIARIATKSAKLGFAKAMFVNLILEKLYKDKSLNKNQSKSRTIIRDRVERITADFGVVMSELEKFIEHYDKN